MKKQNLYYRTTFRRFNLIKDSILGLVFHLCSYPRLLIEVFIRTDFGHRYFSLAAALSVFSLLAFIPFLQSGLYFDLDMLYYVLTDNPLWYGYLFTFLFFSWKRYRELKVKGGWYDHRWFSLSAGVRRDFFEKFTFNGKTPNSRVMTIWIEPLPFFIVGILLLFFHSILGILLVFCSIMYCLSYMAAYHIGDNLIWDIIDEKIVSEATTKYYEGDEDTVAKRGVQFYTDRPDDKELGKIIANGMNQKEDDSDETSYAF